MSILELRNRYTFISAYKIVMGESNTRKALLLSAFALFAINLTAQNKGAKWKGWASPSIGYISGSYEVSGDLRAQGGLKKNGWNVGIGAGVDYYRFASFPIYAQATKMIGKRNGKPFITTSVGINIPSSNIPQYNFDDVIFLSSSIRAPDPVEKKYQPGIIAEIGGGYAFLNKKGRGLMLSLNYSQKRLTETGINYLYTVQMSGEATEEKTKYIMNRAALRIGYIF